MKRPTIRDVAARAGVSHQTVSRVLNGDRQVIAPTRERVLAAMHELDYMPNGIARSLSSNRTHTLGIVTGDISGYAVGQLVAGVEAEARRHGYLLLIGSVQTGDEADRRAHLRLMLQRGVEGLILAWPSLPPEGDEVLAWVAARAPLVTATSRTDLPGIGTISVDNRRGSAEATGHLLAAGHRTIATIAGPARWRAAEARLQGYHDALRAAGLAPDSALIERAEDWEPDSGQSAAARLLTAAAPFTALFAQSDLLALGALTALRAVGRKVPEDVSVVGFDDVPVARHLDPPLTTMRQPMPELGALAVALLVDRLGQRRAEWPAEPVRHLLPASLVERASVRALTS